jgi:beta-galactosidase
VEAVGENPEDQHFVIYNQYLDTPLSAFHCTVQLTAGGELLNQKRLQLDTPPQESSTFLPEELGLTGENSQSGSLYHLTFRFTLKVATAWAEAGHVVAEEQFSWRSPVTVEETETVVENESQPLTYRFEGKDLLIENERVQASFDENGALVNFKVDGQQWITRPVQFNFWRTLTDNDRGLASLVPAAERFQVPTYWRRAMKKKRLSSMKANFMKDGSILVSTYWNVRHVIGKAELYFSITPDGKLTIQYTVHPRRKMLRLGVEMGLNGCLRTAQFFAHGPQENMDDRKLGSPKAIYSSPIKALKHDYVKPQFNGNRCNTEWVRFIDAEGKGIQCTALGHAFNFSIWDYTSEDLEQAKHFNDLPEREDYTFNVDYYQAGAHFDFLGGGQDRQYLTKGKEYTQVFTFEPIIGLQVQNEA